MKKLTRPHSILSDLRIAIASALFILAAAVSFVALGTGKVQAQNIRNRSTPNTHQTFNGVVGVSLDAPISQGTYRHPPSPICNTTPSLDPNVNTDCEGTGPHNETTIAINPTNSLNRIGSANDYQLALNGNYATFTLFSRAHVTFDGGQT